MKKFLGTKFGPKEQKSDPKLGFCHFLKFGSLSFVQIAQNDSFQQFLTSGGDKIYKKIFGAQIWAKGAKIRPKTRFYAIFSSLVDQFFCEIAYSDNLQQCITCSRGKTHKMFFWESSLGQTSQNEAQNQVFCKFLKFCSSVILQIDSSEQCLNFANGPNLSETGQNRV